LLSLAFPELPSMNINKSKPSRMIDIANRANVSRTAVTHVLTGAGKGKVGGVSKAKAEEIRRIAAELGYVPNLTAQQLAGKSSGIVGAIASQWWSTESRFFTILQKACAARNLDILAVQANRGVDSVERFVETSLGRGVEAVIVLSFLHDNIWMEAAQVLARFPRVISVVINPEIPGSRAIESDIAGGMRQAVEHLHLQGRKKIVSLLEDLDTKMNCLRYQSFCDTLASLGRPVEPDQLFLDTKDWSDANYPDFEALVAKMLRTGADAIIADSDFGAAFTCKSLAALGYRVPEDVAVVGWGNEIVARWCNPRLTTVCYEFENIVEKCLDMLAGWSENSAEDGPLWKTVPMKLVIRESA
jgi:DNA-binding LacI/PurR family transcriptional regulator